MLPPQSQGGGGGRGRRGLAGGGEGMKVGSSRKWVGGTQYEEMKKEGKSIK